MKVIDFFRRIAAAGGDVTRMSYTIRRKRKRVKSDEGIRAILSFDGVRLRAKDSTKDRPFYAVDRFLYENDYEIKINGLVKREDGSRGSGLRKSDSTVLVTFLVND